MTRSADERVASQTGSYVVLMSSFMALFFSSGMGYAVGVFHVAMLETYKADPNLTVWVGSTYFCMVALAGPVGSIIINLTNCRTCVIMSGVLGLIGFSTNVFIYDIRWLFITYAFLAGTGTSLANTGAIVVLGYHFKDRLSIITGIGACGVALGIFVHPPLCQFLIDKFGLKGAFLITGAIVFNTCVCGMLMKPSPFEKKKHSMILSGRPRRYVTFKLLFCSCNGIKQIMTNKSYIFFLLSCCAFGMGISTLYLFLPDYLQHRGITSQASSFSVSFSGIGSILSRVLTGVAAHEEKIGSGMIFLSLNGLMGTLSLLISLFTISSISVCIYGILIGLYSGGIWGLLCPLTVDILNIEMMATGFGVVMSACGIGMMTGPPLADYIFEMSATYYGVHLFTAVVFFFCAICMLISASLMSEKGTLRVKDHKSSDVIELEEMDKILPE